ncbi:DUF1569 domain-containing protein [Colwellia sp. RE-S-Sl-9]
MERRAFLKASIIGGTSIGVISGGAIWLNLGVNPKELTIDFALKKLATLSGQQILSTGAWNAYQIFMHCAQSIEYSMQGFPEHKSDTFKNTVGQLAFAIFSTKGKMIHNLSEAIPGAPFISPEQNIQLALQRLTHAFTEFKQYKGALAPHFAYGELSKNEYEIAHVIHLNNHLQEING